jgi:hypothetical protein
MGENPREWKKSGRRKAETGERTSSGILKKFRGRFAMARLKAIESRSGLRYGGVSGLGGGWFVGGTPTLLEGRAFKMILLSMILPYSR